MEVPALLAPWAQRIKATPCLRHHGPWHAHIPSLINRKYIFLTQEGSPGHGHLGKEEAFTLSQPGAPLLPAGRLPCFATLPTDSMPGEGMGLVPKPTPMSSPADSNKEAVLHTDLQAHSGTPPPHGTSRLPFTRPERHVGGTADRPGQQ